MAHMDRHSDHTRGRHAQERRSERRSSNWQSSGSSWRASRKRAGAGIFYLTAAHAVGNEKGNPSLPFPANRAPFLSRTLWYDCCLSGCQNGPQNEQMRLERERTVIRRIMIRCGEYVSFGLVMACVTGLVCVGSAVLVKEVDLRGPSVKRLEPQATTDLFLSILLIERPAERLERAFRQIGPSDRVLFVGPGEEPFFTQVYYTVSYVAFPRLVSAVACGDAGKEPVRIMFQMAETSNIKGLVFFKVDPGRWAMGGTQVGPRMYIAPHDGARPWKSFCP